MRIKNKIFILFFILLQERSAYSDLKGYAKTIAAFAQQKVEQKEYSDTLFSQIFRFDYKMDILFESHLDVSYEPSISYFSRKQWAQSYWEQTQPRYRLWNDRINWLDSSKEHAIFLTHRIDRFVFKKSHDTFDLKVGRQAISYGSSYGVSINSMFLGSNIYQLDSEYQKGIDAVRILVPWDNIGEWEGTFVFQKNTPSVKTPKIMRIKLPVESVDIETVISTYFDAIQIGTSLASDLLNFGWTFEGVCTKPAQEKPYILTNFGLNKRLSQNNTVFAEYLHSSEGSSDPEKKPTDFSYTTGNLSLVGKDYIILGTSHNLESFINVSSMFMSNIRSLSSLLKLSSQFSLSDDLYLGFDGMISLKLKNQHEFKDLPSRFMFFVSYYW